jgi:hypothetical protein
VGGEKRPSCKRCGTALRITWTKAPATDVYGSPQTDRLGMIGEFTSERERTQKMARLGYSRSPLADAHRGSREMISESYRPQKRNVPKIARRLDTAEGRAARRQELSRSA